jgi:diguanylate cyclase (GGDEF)-like protein
VSPAPVPSRGLRELFPFIGTAILGFILIAATEPVGGIYLAALATGLLVVAMASFVPWSRLPLGLRVIPALVFLLSAALLREAGGGNAAGVAVLALLPIFWIALHGTRAQLAIVLAGVAAFFIAPVLLVGGEAYPRTGIRTAIMFVVVSGIVGFTVQRLVAQVRANSSEIERHGRDLERVAAVARRVASSDAPRNEVCQAVREISGATFAVLLEPHADDHLRSTAMSGLDAPAFGSAPLEQRSAPAIALTTKQPLFIRDADGHHAIDRRLWAEHGRPASMLFEPVLRGGEAIGVLIVGWAERVDDRRRAAIISLLATDAAIAMERADLVQHLSGLALTDALTGIPNRRSLDEHLAAALRNARAGDGALCVAMLDLDHFKAYNDRFGHQDGDRLLKEAVAAWRAVLRPGDVLTRYGGEEFAVLLPGCSKADALVVIERLREATPCRQTCSAGVASWDGVESAECLVGRADDALYVAKAGGRDRTVSAVA